MKDVYVKICDGTVVVDTELSDMVVRLAADLYYDDIVVSELIFTTEFPAVEVVLLPETNDIIVWWD